MWLLIVTLILFCCGAFHHYDAALALLFEECAGIEDSGTYVASQSSCSKYIYCDGNNSFEAACFDDNYYDAERERCVDKESYKCKLNGSNEKESDDDALLFEECAGIEDSGTYVASQRSCSTYIYCDGNNSFEAACFDDNYYDAKRERCVDKESYKCKLNESNKIEIDDDDLKEPPVKVPDSKTTTTIATPAVNQQKPQQQQQQQKQNQTNNTAAIEPPSILGITTSETLGMFTCLPATENDRNGTMHYQLANPASCTSYFLCYNGISIAMSCARGMYFNRLSGRCAPAETVTCVWPQRPIAVRSECREGIYDFMPHDSKCEYFYYCSNGYAMIHHCPLEYTWHYERRTCVHHTQSKCFNTNNNAMPYVAS